jgi:transposase
LLWVGKERTLASFRCFLIVTGDPLAAQIEFVCSEMWKPYLDVIREKCSQVLRILDRFHVLAKMNKALDEVRASESHRMAQAGYEPVLKKSRWCVLKRKEHLTDKQQHRLRDLLRYNLQTVRAYLLKEDFSARQQLSSGLANCPNPNLPMNSDESYFPPRRRRRRTLPSILCAQRLLDEASGEGEAGVGGAVP